MRAVQIDNLRGFLGIRRMDRVPNAQIRKLYRVRKGLMKASYGGSTMWRGIGLARETM